MNDVDLDKLEKELKKKMKEGYTFDVDAFAKLVIEKHLKKEVNVIVENSFNSLNRSLEFLNQLEKIWKEIIRLGETRFSDEPFEDNIQQDFWDCFGDVRGTLTWFMLDIIDLNETFPKNEILEKFHFVYKKMLEPLDLINTSENIINVKYAKQYVEELINILSDFKITYLK